MAFVWVNNLITWFIKKRTHQINFFLKYPHQVQQELLMNLVARCKDTLFGKKYNFKKIGGYKDFVQNVPLHRYEDLSDYIESCRKGDTNVLWDKPIKWFAKSSGTTQSKSKFIPVSAAAIEDCHINGGKDMLCLYLKNNPDAKLFTGKNLKLGGSSAVYKNNKTYFGDLSAIIIENLPFWADFSSAPGHKIALMSEWETKMESVVKDTIHRDITSLAGVPSWMLVLLQKVLEHTGKKNIMEVWPHLEVYFHGGVNFAPYKNQYEKMIPSKNFKYYEIYNASEGFFAIQDTNESKELLLMLDYGIFYEFIPMKNFQETCSEAIPLEEVAIGKNYAIVITTNAGLWRYIIGDTVVFTSLNPYKIKVTGRTKSFINAFGEELMVSNTDTALEQTCKSTDAAILEYTAAPIFMDEKQKGGHQWLIAFKKEPESLKDFAEILDTNLQQVNSDYQAKRYKNITLQPPQIKSVPQDLFYNWLKKKNKLGGQHKIPRLCNDRNFIEALLKDI